MVAISKNRIQELTRAELEIMQVLWRIGAGVVRDILEELVAPKPAYNTVSTIVRMLVTKDDYARRYMDQVLSSFFGGSVSRLVSFFSEHKAISVEETDAILKMLRDGR